ncbi:hypothetical protein HK099_006372 [Clydaea vesicula]|uniref:dolichyl-phosphate-mannose--protein mannosyltransferase n=1 Tax=Clydaea vesicula TaxID=447962 RepID=A0AAD5XUB6_9FUNG|nr:hypothetical protein HK099_006372 [Clydaea vesicula]
MGDELRQRKNLPQKIYDGGNNDDEVYSSDQIDDSKLERKEKVFYYAGNKDIRFKTLSILTIIALFIRLFQISHPEQVVFDEVHFGGFASKYIKGQFFMDVHPPLGKLLIAASGLAAGFNGSFDFKEIGMDYIEPRVPYVAMRLLPGILGVGLVPISYITMRNMGASEANSILAAIMVLFENGLAWYIFFVALSAMMWTDFLANQDEPFTLNWWYPLGMSGISIGLAVSVKWVGLFVIATVGVSTLKNLWDLIDEKITFNTFSKHFLARALCLIVLPATVYMAIFKIHFLVLANGGSGNGFMSPEFQATLGGIAKINAFEDVGYYSEIYLRHDGTTGGYLHSHKDTYPSGSKQQQITTYPFTDENSIFTVLPKLLEYNGTFVPETVEGFVKLKHKDIVRLQHKPTKKFLHSHDVRPSVTDNKDHNEVSGYGAEGFSGDTNDHWRIELENEHDTLKALTKFRLVHVNTGCFLFSHKVKLPKWGYEQQEVTCTRVGRRYLTLWRIEGNENPRSIFFTVLTSILIFILLQCQLILKK